VSQTVSSLKTSPEQKIRLAVRKTSDFTISSVKMSPFAIVLGAFLISSACAADNRVKVSAYYETLCPDSIHFVKTQLWPTHNEIGDIIEVDLVPYGKASYQELPDGSVIFRCQHGARECHGNKVQACALSILNDTDLTLAFVYCMESQRFPDRAGQKCAERLNINWPPIDECSTGSAGEQDLLALGKRTEQQHLNFVPWINIDDVHTTDNQDEALHNLKGVVCKAYKGNSPPPACAKYLSTTEEPVEGNTTEASLV